MRTWIAVRPFKAYVYYSLNMREMVADCRSPARMCLCMATVWTIVTSVTFSGIRFYSVALLNLLSSDFHRFCRILRINKGTFRRRNVGRLNVRCRNQHHFRQLANAMIYGAEIKFSSKRFGMPNFNHLSISTSLDAECNCCISSKFIWLRQRLPINWLCDMSSCIRSSHRIWL